MANKRMISADIITSDAFITMRPEAQALYIQCVINADDDGLLDNMKSVLRSLALRTPTLNELLKNNFILDLSDGVYAIKHWWIMNNAIKTDRKKDTKYPEKLKLLRIKENKAYTLRISSVENAEKIIDEWKTNGSKVEDIWRQNGRQMEDSWKRRLD